MSDTPRTDVTAALEARQDAAECAQRIAEDGFSEPSRIILKALTLLDTAVITLERELARLTAENEALRKDAERYRWLRDNVTWFDPRRHASPVLGPCSTRIFYHASNFSVDTLDAAIDAAIKEGL